MYGAIVGNWIFWPLYMATTSCLSSDIIEGICIPWGVISDYTIPSINLISTYLLPLIMMLFCYTRIVYNLRCKVISRRLR